MGCAASVKLSEQENVDFVKKNPEQQKIWLDDDTQGGRYSWEELTPAMQVVARNLLGYTEAVWDEDFDAVKTEWYNMHDTQRMTFVENCCDHWRWEDLSPELHDTASRFC
jgi:hypothetical protein